jgi:hypothetical protein
MLRRTTTASAWSMPGHCSDHQQGRPRSGAAAPASIPHTAAPRRPHRSGPEKNRQPHHPAGPTATAGHNNPIPRAARTPQASCLRQQRRWPRECTQPPSALPPRLDTHRRLHQNCITARAPPRRPHERAPLPPARGRRPGVRAPPRCDRRIPAPLWERGPPPPRQGPAAAAAGKRSREGPAAGGARVSPSRQRRRRGAWIVSLLLTSTALDRA